MRFKEIIMNLLDVRDDASSIWDKKANAFSKNMAKHMSNIKVLLLGPGFPEGQLEIRQEVAKKLKGKGCKVIIMEDLAPISSFHIDEKFRDILDHKEPNVIISIFTEEGKPHAVIYEIGFVCGHLGIKKALEILGFCIHHKLEKIEQVPGYLHGFIARAEYYEFYDESRGPTLYDRILHIVRNEAVRQSNLTNKS